ncbi:MAG: TetR family transcriptional regulator [bacterium]|nr:TetR family transcriptional regulator [bacterium]
MVRRNLYHREDVVAAAVSVVRAEGFAQLSARRVADRLGASTAPVYSNFANMEELAQAVKLAIADLVVAETEVCRSGEPFLDMGIGVLAFARSHPELYAAVFMPGHRRSGSRAPPAAGAARAHVGRGIAGGIGSGRAPDPAAEDGDLHAGTGPARDGRPHRRGIVGRGADAAERSRQGHGDRRLQPAAAFRSRDRTAGQAVRVPRGATERQTGT